MVLAFLKWYGSTGDRVHRQTGLTVFTDMFLHLQCAYHLANQLLDTHDLGGLQTDSDHRINSKLWSIAKV